MQETTQDKSESGHLMASVLCLETTWDSSFDTPCSLVPFLNRPFVHHVIERLVLQGHTEIDFLSQQHTEKFEQCLGTGARWGAQLRFLHRQGKAPEWRQPQEQYRCSVASHALPRAHPENPSTELIRIDSPAHYLESQEQVMRNGVGEFLTFEQQTKDDQWRGRGVKIHPTAIIQGPSLIGDNARIGAGVYVGPYSVIGPNSVLSRDASVRRSTVMPGVYVGEGLALSDAILFADRLFHVRLETCIPIADWLLVSPV